MVRLTGCVLDNGEDVLSLEIRMIVKNLFKARTAADELKHIAHADAHSANTRASATLRVINRDPAEAI